MKTLASTPASVVLSLSLSLAACGQDARLTGVNPVGSNTSSNTPQTSVPGSSATSGAAPSPVACLPDFVPDNGLCGAHDRVALTGIAAESSALAIAAGAGPQPELRTYVAPELLAPTAQVFVRITGLGFEQSSLVTEAANDGLGTYFSLAIDTRDWPEGTYAARAWLGADMNGIPSETLTIVVDRQAPVMTVTLNGLPAQAGAPRNFVATAAVNATSPGQHAIASMELEALGPLAAKTMPTTTDPWVDFALTPDAEQLPEGISGGEALLSGAQIPDDVAGLNLEAHAVTVRATATDVLGNAGTTLTRIPLD